MTLIDKKGTTLIRLCMFLTLILTVAYGQEGDDENPYDPAPEISENICPLKSGRVIIHVETKEWTGPQGDDFSDIFAAILSPRRDTLAKYYWSNADDKDEWEFECRDSMLVFQKKNEEKDLLLFLVYDRKNGQLTVAPPVVREIDSLWRNQIKTEKTLRRSKWLAEALKLLSPLDIRLQFKVRLAEANHEISLGHWRDVDSGLVTWKDDAADTDFLSGYKVEKPYLDNFQTLQRRLDSLRTATLPLRPVGWKRLGILPNASPVLPPKTPATVFWQSDRLCIVQQDSLRNPEKDKYMRRYNPETGKWSGRVPIERPKQPATTYEQYSRPCDFSEGFVIEGFDMGCEPFPEYRLLSVFPGPRAMIDGGGSIGFAKPGHKPDGDYVYESSDAQTVSKKLLASPGTRVAGNGNFIFSLKGELYRVDEPLRTWKPLTKGPVKGWSPGNPLVSPDQKWILVFVNEPGKRDVALWIARLLPR